MAFQCLRGMYIVPSVNTRYVLMPKCVVIMALTKNHVFEALDAFKITWLQNIQGYFIKPFLALDAFKITWLQNEDFDLSLLRVVLDASKITLLQNLQFTYSAAFGLLFSFPYFQNTY